MTESTLIARPQEALVSAEFGQACSGPLSDTRHGNPLFLQMIELARKIGVEH